MSNNQITWAEINEKPLSTSILQTKTTTQELLWLQDILASRSKCTRVPKYVLLGFPKIQQKLQASLSTSMMAGLLSSACNKACVQGVQGYLGLSGICRSDLDFSKNQIFHILQISFRTKALREENSLRMWAANSLASNGKPIVAIILAREPL